MNINVDVDVDVDVDADLNSLCYTEISGSRFNHLFKGIKFYKFLFNNLVHRGFEYELGLNIDIKPFNPHGKCSEGGMYFCDETACHLFWHEYGQKIGTVRIPNDARVYIEKDKFKTDKLVLIDIIDFKNMSDDFWINMLDKEGLVFRFIKHQTEELCKIAVRQNCLALEFVENQTEEICITAIRSCTYALRFVKDQTKAICKEAVSRTGELLWRVKEQTNEICEIAVQQNGLALRHVRNQTENICKIAVQQCGDALMYVINQTQEICIMAVQQDGLALRHVKIQNDYIRTLAVQQNTAAKQYFVY